MMHCALFVSSRLTSGGLNLTSDVQCEKPFKGFLNDKMLIPHIFRGAFCCFFAIRKLTTVPYFVFQSCVTHSYCKSLHSCCRGCNQNSEFIPNNLNAWGEKKTVRKSCLVQNRCNNHGCQVQVDTHHEISAWVLKVLSTIRFVNYTHSGPRIFKNVTFIVCFTFLLKMTFWRWQNKWSEPRWLRGFSAIQDCGSKCSLLENTSSDQAFTECTFSLWTFVAKEEKKKLYIVILISHPVLFNWYPINPLLALSFENIGIKTVLNKILFLRYTFDLFNCPFAPASLICTVY